MDKNDKILQIISNETIDATNSMSIITPSIYATLFQEKAKAHNVDIDDKDEIELSKELIHDECLNLIEMREQNNKNTIRLSSSTSKAIDAIQQKDEKSLNEVLKEAEELRREIETLKEAIYKDELTSVYNRKFLKDKYLNEDSDSFKSKGILTIVDLNYFKKINDTYGHAVGDKVLIFIANHLKKAKADVVRYGGDEFLILFDKNTTIEEAISIIDKIHESITHKKLKAKNGEFRVSFSLGISRFKQGDSFSHTLEVADTKMYENKEEMKQIITDI